MQSNVTATVLCGAIALMSTIGIAEAQNQPEPTTTSPQETSAFAECMDAVDLGAFKNTQFERCWRAELSRQDGRLNTGYDRLRASINRQAQAALVKGQRAWLAYRDAWCAFEGASDEPPSPEVNRLNCLVEQTKAQAARIEASAKF